MNTEKEHYDVEYSTTLHLIASMDSTKPSITDFDSVFIRVHPWQESSFIVPIHSRENNLWNIH
jgi:hypothetical protein